MLLRLDFLFISRGSAAAHFSEDSLRQDSSDEPVTADMEDIVGMYHRIINTLPSRVAYTNPLPYSDKFLRTKNGHINSLALD